MTVLSNLLAALCVKSQSKGCNLCHTGVDISALEWMLTSSWLGWATSIIYRSLQPNKTLGLTASSITLWWILRALSGRGWHKAQSGERTSSCPTVTIPMPAARALWIAACSFSTTPILNDSQRRSVMWDSHNPQVITILIGGIESIPSHGRFMAAKLSSHPNTGASSSTWATDRLYVMMIQPG